MVRLRPSLGSARRTSLAARTQLDKQVPPRPNPTAVIASWKYQEVRPTLLEAGDIVGAEEAERRVLMLVNPALEAPYTTDTIYAGLQLVLHGEVAPAHRHVAFALRFIIEGAGGFTAVEGEKIPMERGDVILTPSWHWHDHGNDGEKPMIWLDGLDLPLYRYAKVNFAEPYADKTYPSKPAPNSRLRFPWPAAQKELDSQSGCHAIHHYRHASGSHLSKTLSAQAERHAAGSTTPWSRETTSFVYHVYEGDGYSELQVRDSDAVEKVNWRAGDVFSVPAWTRIRHVCTQSSGSAYLFAINDRPMLESLGLYRSVSAAT